MAPARRVGSIAEQVAGLAPPAVLAGTDEPVARNTRIHDVDCLHLNPATNVMNPAQRRRCRPGWLPGPRSAIRVGSTRPGWRPSRRSRWVAAEPAAQVVRAGYAEVRVGSGALANLSAFLATCRPGDTIIAPPAAVGGRLTHHGDGPAALYGPTTVRAPVSADGYTGDVAGATAVARRRPDCAGRTCSPATSGFRRRRYRAI